jgi:hypothetical protein
LAAKHEPVSDFVVVPCELALKGHGFVLKGRGFVLKGHGFSRAVSLVFLLRL